MAKAHGKRQVLVILSLEEDEAKFIMGAIQNPHCHPEEEDEREAEMRHAIFDSLKQAIKEAGGNPNAF